MYDKKNWPQKLNASLHYLVLLMSLLVSTERDSFSMFKMNRFIKIFNQSIYMNAFTSLSRSEDSVDLPLHTYPHQRIHPVITHHWKGIPPALIGAIQAGHFQETHQLLRQTEGDCSVLLPLAIQSQSLEMVQLLLKHGADVHYRNAVGNTALIYAILYDHPPIIHTLITHGADVNRANQDGVTALLFTVRRISDPSILQELIHHGANVNHVDHQGSSALTDSVHNLHSDVENIHTLIQAGADLHHVDRYGKTALQQAFQDYAHIYELNGQEAMITRFLAIISALIEAGADVNYKDPTGITPLLCATQANRLNCVQFLITQGANVNDSNHDGQTALIMATMQNNAELIKILLKNNADPSLVDRWNRTALIIAKKYHYPKLERLLHEFSDVKSQ